MKLMKLSMAAIMALGFASAAMADVENVKFSGDAKLFYGTNDADAGNKEADLFDQSSSYGQAALDLAATADLANGVKGKVKITALSTLGLENNLVSAVWAGQTTETTWWASEVWLAKTFANTTIKVGRQELDTPLAFSEKWNIVSNSFDAAVILNNDLPDTTLVAAWVGKGNGHNGGSVVNVPGTDSTDYFRTYGSAIDDTLGNNTNTNADGAYAFGVVTKAIPNVTAQAWYYDVQNIAKAYWLQADVNLKDVASGLIFGVQYANIDVDDLYVTNAFITDVDESSAWAVKLGYDFKDAAPGLKACVSYSSTDDDGVVDIANTATGLNKSVSKLYTEAWWNYGYVSAPATDAWNVKVKYSMEDVADFGAYYTHTEYDHTAKNAAVIALIHGSEWNTNNDVEMDEFALTASKSFGNLNATLAYIYTDADDQNIDANGNADSYNTIQVYLTYNF